MCALATLSGEQLGRPPELGLLRMALDEYAAVRQAVMDSSPDFYWVLQDAPRAARLGAGLELVHFWEHPQYVLRKPGDVSGFTPPRLAKAPEAAMAILRAGLPVAEVLANIKEVAHACRAALRRSCRRCGQHAFWDDLSVVGAQSDGEGGSMELRNCMCGTTFALTTVVP